MYAEIAPADTTAPAFISPEAGAALIAIGSYWSM
jgi:hypothetical protein